MEIKKYKKWILYASIAMMFLVIKISPSSIQIGGYRLNGLQINATAILLFALINWIMETIPVAVTALVVIVVVPFAGIMTFAEAIQGSFGNTIFAFFLGALILSEAFSQTNLGKQIAMGMFRIFGKTPRAIIFAIMLSGLVLAMWVTEVAAAAIVFPIALSIVEQIEDREMKRNFGKAAMLAVAWGCAFGGVATPIATGANLIALSYLEEYCGIGISFMQWMKIGVPISLTFLVAGWLLLSGLIKDNTEISIDENKIPLGPQEKKLIAVFLTAVTLWIFGNCLKFSSHHVALSVAIVLFLPGVDVLQWKKTMSSLSWDSIMLICAGVLIGDLLYQCGLAKIMADVFFVPEFLQKGILVTSIYIVLTVAVLKIMFSSNTVTGVVLVPIMIMLAGKVGLSPWQMVAPCIFSSALSLIIITSSPVNVIPYSAKYFTAGDMLKYGIPMTVISAIVVGFWLSVCGL